MKEEKNDILRVKIIFLLSIIASFLIVIFSCPSASALQVKYPDIISGNYYGYKVPQRNIKLNDNENSNYVNVGLGYFTCINNNVESCTPTNFIPYDYGKSYIKNYVLPQYILDSDDSLRATDYYTSSINTSRTVGTNYYNNYRYMIPYWGFHPSSSVNTPIEMFESNEGIYYNGDFTYDFDFILFNQLGLLSGDINTWFDACSTWVDSSNNTRFTCTSGQYAFDIQTIKKDNYYQHYKISTYYWNNYGKAGFNQQATWLNNGVDSYYNVSRGWAFNDSSKLINIGSTINGAVFTEIYISQPYNIIYYTTDSAIYCSDKCASDSTAILDDNTDGTGIYDNLTNDFTNSVNNLIGRDYGFSGIVNKTFNFVSDILNSSRTNTCYTASVVMLGQTITLPCGVSFWNRQDMQTFNTTYSLVFIGAVAYMLAWKIYKNLLSAFSPDSKIIDESEVDGL